MDNFNKAEHEILYINVSKFTLHRTDNTHKNQDFT